MNQSPPTPRHVTLLRVTLRFLDRWAVGGVALSTDETDLPVLTDPRGVEAGMTAYLPGTSVAGSLKRHLGDEAARWLGADPAGWEEVTGDVTRAASALAVLGIHTGGLGIRARGSTAVDRQRGAAKAQTLRREQWVDAGEVVAFFEHDGARDSDLVARLLTWRPVLGRGATSGMGAAVPITVETVSLDLTDPAHLTWWLQGRSDWFDDTAASTPPEGTGHTETNPDDAYDECHGREVVLDVTWRVVEPVHVGFEEASPGRDGEPTVDRTLRRVPGNDQPVMVPGSSWKGILRHRCQHILDAIAGDMDTDEADAIRDTVVHWMFGSTDRPGRLIFRDSFGDPSTVRRHHVAIDRFTGGAMDSALFTVEAITPGSTLRQRVEATEEVPGPVRQLLAHVVRDLNDGIVGVGSGATRGYGTVGLPQGQPPETEPLVLQHFIDLAHALTADDTPAAGAPEMEATS